MADSKAKKRLMKVATDERYAHLDDGCDAWLVDGARFDGVLGIPVIEAPERISVPSAMVPFSKRAKVSSPAHYAVCEYEPDRAFAPLLKDPAAHVKELRRFQAVVSPDASMYWDMPLAAQVLNKYRNHAVASWLQRQGVYVIPNVRWGDERTYTDCALPEPLAFLGVEKGSIVSIGSYGVVKTADEKRHFRAGLAAMLERLEPQVVLVYGSTPDDVFGGFWDASEFVRYPDWTSHERRGLPDSQGEDEIAVGRSNG